MTRSPSDGSDETWASAAPDGSPVEVYRHLPPGDDPLLIHRAARAGASILELGCGAGRVTHPLLALGHRVTAVDESEAMLAHVRDAEVVHADVIGLDLGRRFDAVVLASHLINDPDAQRRRELLATCARHVGVDGVVVVQRFAPDWVRTAVPGEGRQGPVVVRLSEVVHDGDRLHASVSYEVGGQRLTQRFTASVVDDDLLAEEADRVDLRIDRWIDHRREWAVLRMSA